MGKAACVQSSDEERPRGRKTVPRPRACAMLLRNRLLLRECPNPDDRSKGVTRPTVRSRVNRLLSGIRERAAREMAERAAGAMLVGKPLDEIHFEDLESLDGVEEAIRHIALSGPDPRGHADAAAAYARTAAENFGEGLMETVRGAAETVRAEEGTDFWVCTKGRIADLICAEIARSWQTRDESGGGERETGRAGPENARAHQVPGTTASAPSNVGLPAAQSWRARRAEDEAIFGNPIDPEWSMNDWQRELAIHPDNVGAHFLLAQAFQDAGNLEAAVAEFSEVARLAPDDPEGHWCLGDVLHATGELEIAASEYACALKMAPGNEWVAEMYLLLDPRMKDRVHQHITGANRKAQATSTKNPTPPPELPPATVCPNCEARIGTSHVLEGPEDLLPGGHYEIVVADDSCEQCRKLEGVKISRQDLPRIVPPAERSRNIECWCALVYYPPRSPRASGPKKPVRLADLKRTQGGKFDLSGLTKSELADLIWEEAAKRKEK